jgi:methylated-DNA-[protein]-cysteine S-methyltransferase
MPIFDTRNLTIFQKFVLLKLKTSEFGSIISYGQLASKANSPRASRAVGSVMAMNPWPIIVPCHRVVRSDGIIGNYSGVGGKTTKQWLLNHERIES